MANPEKDLNIENRPDYLEFVVAEPEPVTIALIDALVDHNDKAQAVGLLACVQEWNQDKFYDPTLTTQSFGNSFELTRDRIDRANTAKLRLGSYVPNEGVVLYSDFGSEDYQDRILDAAKDLRERSIYGFNQNTDPEARRSDYTNPMVEVLHAELSAFLTDFRLGYRMLENRRNFLQENKLAGLLYEMDDRSQLAICLRFAPAGLALRGVGLYTSRGEYKARQEVTYLDFLKGNITMLAGTENTLTPLNGMVDEEMVDEFVHQARKIWAVKGALMASGLEFDTQDLAVKLPPEASMR